MPAKANKLNKLSKPHPLQLYRHAVQHPLAEVAFINRLFLERFGEAPYLLREDFAGTSIIASTFVQDHPDNQALAIENHRPTHRWAAKHIGKELQDTNRSDDLHFLHADSTSFRGPRCDVAIALNFSLFIFHTTAQLTRYLKHVKRCLQPAKQQPSLFLADFYLGPSARKPLQQTRTIHPDDLSLPSYTYTWQQKSFNPITNQTHCAIHFDTKEPTTNKPLTDYSHPNAFKYHWRLWSPIELQEAALTAGYQQADIYLRDPQTHQANPHQPKLTEDTDQVGYLVAQP